MFRPARVVTIALFGFLVATPVDAAISRGREAAVSFSASGPGGLKIEGKTAEIAASEAGGKIHFAVPLAHLDTGIELRNKHMRDKYLEVGKFPNAELVVDRSALKAPADGQDSSGSLPGTMTIHGQTRPVNVAYKAHRAGAAYQVSGTVHLDIREFGIVVPSYLGVTVKPEVEVAVRVTVDEA